MLGILGDVIMLRPALLSSVCLMFGATSHADQAAKPKKKTPTLPAGVEVDRDITYAVPEQGPQKLDVYRPADFEGRLPTIVFVHGGGWKAGDKKSAVKTAAWIVPEGYALVSINYRLLDVAQWPAQINDCYAAVRWVRDHADEYGFDPDHVAAWGTSAGGHLVALMGTRPYPDQETTSSRVQAVCDWFGPADLLTMPPNTVSKTRTFEQVAKSNGARLLGAPVPTIPAKAKDASGLYHVTSDDAPTLIMHGSKDPGVPVDQSRRLARAFAQAGVEHQFHIVEGAGHSGPEFAKDESRAIVRSFFARILKKDTNQ